MLLFCLTFLMIGYLYASPIAVLKFDPALEGVSYNDYIIYLPIKPEQNVSTGFTICLRTKFDTLESKCIFEAERDLSFRLHDFRWDGGGGIILANSETSYKNEPDLDRLSTWQSFCATYEKISTKVKVFKNQFLKLDFEKNLGNQNLGKHLALGFCQKTPFKGHITDFNAWSR